MKLLLMTFALLCLSLADKNQILKEFSTGYNSFSSKIYKELLKTNSDNFIVSPLSVDIGLALANVGAKDQTTKELTKALGLPENPEKIKEIFTALSPNLRGTDQYNLNSANKIYVKHDFVISDEFKNVAVNVFDAEIQNLDFERKAEAASKINQWVQQKTHDKIKNLVDPSMLDEYTRAVLVNAIYFRGKWVNEFKKRDTLKLPFHVGNKQQIRTDMMTQTESLDYYESSELNAKFLKLNYRGGDISLHIVLPNDVEGLASLEEKVEDLLVPPKYTKEEVVVTLPKFKTETKIVFKPILQAIGVAKAFEDDANFRGISAEGKDLKISEVVQKAFIEVDETGTTAAAATGVIMTVPLSAIVHLSPPKVFRADHPFLFYLRLNKPGVNFFVGRYTSPSQ